MKSKEKCFRYRNTVKCFLFPENQNGRWSLLNSESYIGPLWEMGETQVKALTDQQDYKEEGTWLCLNIMMRNKIRRKKISEGGASNIFSFM